MINAGDQTDEVINPYATAHFQFVDDLGVLLLLSYVFAGIALILLLISFIPGLKQRLKK